MPLEPPWPMEVLDLLRAASALLQRAREANPRDPAIDSVTADIDAAISKLGPLARSQDRPLG